MSSLLEAPVRLVYADEGSDTITVQELHTFLLDAFETVFQEEGHLPGPCELILNDVVRVEAQPETWAVLLNLIGDTLHRE